MFCRTLFVLLLLAILLSVLRLTDSDLQTLLSGFMLLNL